MEINKIYQGCALEVLKTFEDNSIDCCVTSPPYFGLRDYGTASWEGGNSECFHQGEIIKSGAGSLKLASNFGANDISPGDCIKCGAIRIDSQIGLEKTPELYVSKLVEVFIEVKRVLKKEGTLWLNLGDSYAAYYGDKYGKAQSFSPTRNNIGNAPPSKKSFDFRTTSFKPKDQLLIPFEVAKALRGPFYTGKIKNRSDRIWLAAMIDGEGCMFLHKRKSGTNNHSKYTKKDGSVSEYSRKNDTYGAGLEVANTHRSIVERCFQITGIGSICTVERESALKNRNIPLHRWNVRSNECREIIKEIYPYLVAKKHEARILLNCPSAGDVAEKCHMALMRVHNGKNTDIDFPPPTSFFVPGFYLRQDIIWHKLNPMPESVTDRCTKSHEYIFLLSKSAKYYYDAEAIKTDVKDSTIQRMLQQIENQKGSDRVPGKTNGTMKAVGPGRTTRKGIDIKGGNQGSEIGIPAMAINGNGVNGHSGYFNADGELVGGGKANKKSVWTVNTMPYSEAHFATFPERLIVDMIKAGCPEGGIVLDPFAGSCTTPLVARKLNRNFVAIELNPGYIKLGEERLRKELGLFI